MRRWWDWFRHYGVWILIALCAAAYYPRFAHDYSGGIARSGLALLTHGAQCLRDNAVMQQCDLFFTYPATFALMMMPFTELGTTAGLVLWYLVTIGASIVAYLLCEALVRDLYPGEWTDGELDWLRIGSVLLSLKFVLAVLENQAFDTHVFFFIVLGLWALAGKREWLGGSMIAVAAAMKGVPLIFLPYLLFTKRFRASAAFIGAYLVASFLPDLIFTPKGGAHGYYVTWIHDIALGPMYDDPERSKYIFWGTVNSNNHSLRSLAYRLFPAGLADWRFRPTLIAMYLPVIAAVVFVVWRSMRAGGKIAVDGSAILIAMLALSPMTSRSHYIALMLPYTVICAVAIREHSRRTMTVAVLGVSFLLVTVSGNDVVGRTFTDWSYAHGSILFGSLLLLAYLVVLAAWPSPRTQAAVASAHAGNAG